MAFWKQAASKLWHDYLPDVSSCSFTRMSAMNKKRGKEILLGQTPVIQPLLPKVQL